MSKTAVESFMRNANRPHSVNDVQQHLSKDIGKSAVQKALDQLVDEGKLNEKLYGKQKIYWYAQKDDSTQAIENMGSLEQQIREAHDEFTSVDTQLKKVEAELKTLDKTLSTSEAKAQNEKLATDNEFLRCTLMRLEKANLMISEEDRRKVHDSWSMAVTAYRKRKRMCTDILDQILENYPKSKKHLYQEIGIEDDDGSEVSALKI